MEYGSFYKNNTMFSEKYDKEEIEEAVEAFYEMLTKGAVEEARFEKAFNTPLNKTPIIDEILCKVFHCKHVATQLQEHFVFPVLPENARPLSMAKIQEMFQVKNRIEGYTCCLLTVAFYGAFYREDSNISLDDVTKEDIFSFFDSAMEEIYRDSSEIEDSNTDWKSVASYWVNLPSEGSPDSKDSIFRKVVTFLKKNILIETGRTRYRLSDRGIALVNTFFAREEYSRDLFGKMERFIEKQKSHEEEKNIQEEEPMENA